MLLFGVSALVVGLFLLFFTICYFINHNNFYGDLVLNILFIFSIACISIGIGFLYSYISFKKKEKKKHSDKFISKKVKFIIFAILMMLSPVFIMFCSFEDDKIYTIITLFVGLCFFIGFLILGLALVGHYDESNADKNIVVSSYNQLTYWEIIRTNLLILSIPSFLFFSMLLFEGIYMLESFIYYYGFAIVVFIVMLFISKKQDIKRMLLVDGIMSFIIILLSIIPVPYDIGMDTINDNTFKNTFEKHGFIVSIEEEISGLDINDSQIYLAKKDDMNVYFIVSDNNRISKKIYKSFESIADNCSFNKNISKVGYLTMIDCSDPVYSMKISRVKNTILYFEFNNEDDEFVDILLNDFDYDY